MTENTSSTTPKTISQTKAVIVVALMFALFVIPNIYILYVYKTGDLPDTGTNEKGTFFKPFIAMQTHSFQALDEKHFQAEALKNNGIWVIMSFADKGCEQSCFDSIFNTQQAISALTRYKGRVEHIILADKTLAASTELQSISHLKHFSYLLEDETLMPTIKAQIQHDNLNNTQAIMDPESQLLLFYSEDNSVQEVLRDIQRLLQSSATRYSSH